MKTSKKLFTAFLVLIAAAITFTGVKSAGHVSPTPSVSIVVPANGSTIAASEFTSISGTVEGKFDYVGVSIKRAESDLEWDPDFRVVDKNNNFVGLGKWVGGPTGKWMTTTIKMNSWSAPHGEQRLPAGANLRSGQSYVIYAYAANGTDRGEQAMTTFRIR